MSLPKSIVILLFATALLFFYAFTSNPTGAAIASSLFAAALFAIFGMGIGEWKALQSFKPPKIPRGTRKNTVLLVGLGRCGKTTLIETLLKDFNGKPPTITNDFAIVTSTKFVEEKKEFFEIRITDYRGQDLTQLIANFIREQLRPGSLMRYGDINTLILVVDLFRPDFKQRRAARSPIDLSRVRFHLAQWSTTAIDSIFGLLTEGTLKYVCLFVNKVDLFPGIIPTDEIHSAFEPLASDLKSRCRGDVHFEIRVGSALDSRSVLGINDSLKSRLFQYSMPISNG